MCTLSGHTGSVNSLELVSGMLASGSSDATIRLWNLANRACTRVLSGHWMSVNSITSDGREQLASGSDDHTIKIWNVETGKEIQKLEGQKDWIRSLLVLPNGDLVSGSFYKTIKIWLYRIFY